MAKLCLKIFGLDCAEEIAILRGELSPIVAEQQLNFDLLNGKLTIYELPTHITSSEIISLIHKTGMSAQLWDEYQQHLTRETGWHRYGRLIMTSVGIIMLICGFCWHAWQTTWFTALSGGYQEHLHYPFVSKLFYIVAIICGGWFIFPKAIYAIRRMRADMNLLMLIAVCGALIIQQWFEATTVTLLFSLALLLESYSIARARLSIKALMDLVPKTARFYCPHSGKIETKKLADIPLQAIVIVRPSEKIPLDGMLTKGSSYINEAPITGESIPVFKTINDSVYAGTINGDHSIEFKVTKTVDHTTLAHITTMIEEAQHRKATTEQWIDKFAHYYTPLMLLLALFLAFIPPLLFTRPWLASFYQALVILVIACPCALVISTPISIVAGLSRAAHHGILIKGGRFLELPAKLRAIAFDKTATLTTGIAEVRDIIPINGHNEIELLALAAALEIHSDHPIAQAILRKAQFLAIEYQVAESFNNIPGKGAIGIINGIQYWIGSHRLLHEMMPQCESDYLHHNALRLEEQGHSIVAIGNQSHICGLISIADKLRPECPAAITELSGLGIQHIIMLTGDNQGTAAAIAGLCNIEEYKAELLPQDKVTVIKNLVQSYHHVAMVGDGINDAPALATATVGIAMGVAGSDIAIETADIALMSEDLNKLPWLIKHSRLVLTIIKQNIAFALLLKVIFISLAIFGLATLWMAISADMGASLLVILNSLRLLQK